MLAAFTVSITIKQQKISVRPIFPLKGMNSTESSFFCVALPIKRFLTAKKAQDDEFPCIEDFLLTAAML